MAKYEGLITDVKSTGRVEVTIRPERMGIPGAPEVSRRVCHSATDGSIVKVDALNRADATMGDWVRVTQRDGARKRNLAVIAGIPLTGGIVGLLIAAFLSGVTGLSHPLFWVGAAGIGVVFGGVISRRAYVRLAVLNELVVGEVIKTAPDLSAEFGDVRGRMEDTAAACGDCTLCLPETMKGRGC